MRFRDRTVIKFKVAALILNDLVSWKWRCHNFASPIDPCGAQRKSAWFQGVPDFMSDFATNQLHTLIVGSCDGGRFDGNPSSCVVHQFCAATM